MPRTRIGNEPVRATLLATLAAEPHTYNQSQLASQMGCHRQEVVWAVKHYRTTGWIEDAPARTRTELAITPEFWTYINGMLFSLDLRDIDAAHHEAGVGSRAAMETFADGTPEHDAAHVDYLGRAALLSQRHDLGRRQGWFSGAIGWTSLITIEALCPERINHSLAEY
jgi:DNA-binding IclR family transcriptional regulator